MYIVRIGKNWGTVQVEVCQVIFFSVNLCQDSLLTVEKFQVIFFQELFQEAVE